MVGFVCYLPVGWVDGDCWLGSGRVYANLSLSAKIFGEPAPTVWHGA